MTRSVRDDDDPNWDKMDIRSGLHEMSLGGRGSRSGAGRGTLTARVTGLGWRIVPVPNFWSAKQFWHDDKGNWNAAFADFSHPREFLIIPPADIDGVAIKVEGPVVAVRRAVAWAIAEGRWSNAADHRDVRRKPKGDDASRPT